MTTISRPWNGQATLGDDGPYSAEEWCTTWGTMWGNDFLSNTDGNNRGVIQGVLDEYRITANSPASASINVGTGAAFVFGMWAYNLASVALTPDANASGSTRYDIIALYRNPTTQLITEVIVKGTPGAGLPALTQNTVSGEWYLPLAYLELATGFGTIGAANIFDLRRWNNLAQLQGVTVLNNGATVLEAGDICAWDSSADGAVTDTSIHGQNVAGVAVGRIPIAGYGQIIRHGIGLVRVDNAVVRGDLLSASAAANKAGNSGGIRFGRALEAIAANNVGLALIDVKNHDGGFGDWFAIKDTFQAAAPDNCIFLFGQTIGNAASIADVADTETLALFTFLYNNLADAQAPVSGGRGANAALDYAAAKTLTLPDFRGRVSLTRDNLGGTPANVVTQAEADTVAAVQGEQNHILTVPEIPAHTHTITDNNTDVGPDTGGAFFHKANTGTVTSDSTGGGTGHNNMSPYMTVSKFVRL